MPGFHDDRVGRRVRDQVQIRLGRVVSHRPVARDGNAGFFEGMPLGVLVGQAIHDIGRIVSQAEVLGDMSGAHELAIGVRHRCTRVERGDLLGCLLRGGIGDVDDGPESSQQWKGQRDQRCER